MGYKIDNKWIDDGSDLTPKNTRGVTLPSNLTFEDPGTDANSYKIIMVADDSGTPQTGEINVNYGTNPYMRFAPPNAAGAATTAFDVRNDLMSFQDGFVLCTNTANDDNVLFKAVDNDDNTLYEVARLTGAVDPTFDLLKGRLTGALNGNSKNINSIAVEP